MIRTISPCIAAAVLAAGCLTASPAQAKAPHIPGRITAVSSARGPAAGQVVIYWRSDGSHTDNFVLETALTTFSTTSSKLPDHGRSWKTFSISAKKRSIVLTAAQVASAGAPLGSANHLYFRLRAVNRSGSATSVRSYPYLQSVSVRPGAPSRTGTGLRVASFNIHSARAAGGPSWLSRASRVAAEIKAKNPGVVAVQELSPGRADGRSSSTTGSTRQTVSLEQKLRAAGAGKYRLVRTTPYIQPGKSHGSQGTRILYDTSRFTKLSRCSEKTGKRNYSSSCSVELPLLSGDKAGDRRTAAYAVLQSKRTKKRFVVASAHLDARHSKNVASEKRYNALRVAQVNTILARIGRINPDRLPVIFGGDINSWQNNQVAYGPHDRLVANGYYDTAAAQTAVNLRYSTMNGYARTMKPSPSGFGSRLDLIAVRGIRGAKRFENVMKVANSRRPSDHNMVYADIVLPR